ncbi:MAG: right-handed parallel beta-helix repeat-containing protein [Salinivirgaceae bacterium]|jgi:hypothetical protein|nr:right-handed parallel beta-helix repeat-containing protein [Salinivirgaceae bacterium]
MKKILIFLVLINILAVLVANTKSDTLSIVGANIITNGTFDIDDSGWGHYFDYYWDPSNPLAAEASVSVVTKDGYNGNAYKVSIDNAGTANYSVQISYPMPLVADVAYQIKFKASADSSRNVAIDLQQNVDPKTNWFLSDDISLTTTPTTYGPFNFTATETDPSNLFKLYLGGGETENAIAAYFDDIVVTEVIDVIGATVPDSPTLVNATAGNGLAMVEFTAPADTGGLPIRSYTVVTDPSGATTKGASSPIKVTGLTNGETYTFTVIATNAMGNSVASAISNSVTPIFQVTEYFVSNLNGSDDNDGKSISAPFKSIPYASIKVLPGDTIFIMDGTYEPLTISKSGDYLNNITYKACPGHNPIISCGLSGVWNILQISASYITVDGIEVAGINDSLTLEQGETNYNNVKAAKDADTTVDWESSTNTNTNGISIGVRNGDPIQHVTIKNCIIHDCSAGGVGAANADNLLFENNEIYNNSWYTMWATSGISVIDLIAAEPAGSIIIRGNKIYNNYTSVKWIDVLRYSDGNGIIIDVNTGYEGSFLVENNVVFDNGGRGLYIMSAQNALFRNNTSYWNSKSSFSTGGEMVVYDSKDVTYVNNIAWANPAYSTKNYALNDDGAWGSNSNITWKNNITFNGVEGDNSVNIAKTTTTSIDSSNILGVNPMFVNPSIDPAIADFHIQKGSPAINMGTSELEVSNFDFEYMARIINDTVDIGAYESLFTSPPVTTNTQDIKVYPTSENIKVYPTRVVNTVTIVNTKSLEIEKIELFSMKGELIQVVSAINSGENVIDLQSVSKGVYIFRIYTSGQNYFSKIIKE